jgi:hypothetical protein
MSDNTVSSALPSTTTVPNAGRRLARAGAGRRTDVPAAFSLVELPPQLVVKGIKVSDGLLAPDVVPAGRFREMCPHCQDAPLDLALRTHHVIRTHLFCEKCSRCFDVVYHDGISAFTPAAAPIY